MLKRFVLIATLLLPLSACRKAQDSISRGRAYTEGYGCLTCHQAAGRGADVGPDLTFTGFRHSQAWIDVWMRDPRAWKPDTEMPDMRLRDDVRKDITAYLASLKGEDYLKDPRPWDAPALKADPVKRGETIYNRVGCAACHGQAGRGGFPNNNAKPVPALTRSADTLTREQMKAKIRDGVAEVATLDPAGPPPMIKMPGWGGVLREDEMDALVDYLHALRSRAKD